METKLKSSFDEHVAVPIDKKANTLLNSFLQQGSPDMFFDYGTQDEELEQIFFQMYQEFHKHQGDEYALNAYLQHECPLGKYLRSQTEVAQLRGKITMLFSAKAYKIDNPSEKEIEFAAKRLMKVSTKAVNSLAYLAPILAQLEHYSLLFFGDEAAKDKALSFFLLYIVNGILAEPEVSSPFVMLTGRLVQKMISERKTVMGHSEFLAQKTTDAQAAFGSLEQLRARFVHTPVLQQSFNRQFCLRIGTKMKPKKKSVKKWLCTTYKFDPTLADSLYTQALRSVAAQQRSLQVENKNVVATNI